MDYRRWEFLNRCKDMMCDGLPCSCCPLEDFCYYDEDVRIENYIYNKG